nr:anion permease [Candidatus Pantoea persica]
MRRRAASNAREAVQTGEQPLRDGEFLWLHINLNNARARHWVQSHFQVDDDFFEEIGSASSRTRLAELGEALIAVLNDVTFSQEERSAQNATLWI